MNDLYGLTPDEIRQLRKEMDARQKAATDAPSELRSVTIPVSLSPGTMMPTVQVTPGYVSSIVVLDRFGNPWPIKGVSWGNREEYQVEPPPAQGEDSGIPQNIIAVTPLRTIGATSMSILLADKPLPVVIRLVVSRGVTDARADLRIDGLAPGAAPEIRASTIPEQFGDAEMVGFLDGVPPKGSTRLKANSDLIEAWDFKGKMIVRTKGDLVSPRWTGIEHGADDLKVYQTSLVPVVLVLRDGGTNMVTVTLPERNVFDGN
jgi:intracellular multiplication protein IcmK